MIVPRYRITNSVERVKEILENKQGSEVTGNKDGSGELQNDDK